MKSYSKYLFLRGMKQVCFPHNDGVPGSNPGVATIYIKGLQAFSWQPFFIVRDIRVFEPAFLPPKYPSSPYQFLSLAFMNKMP